MELKKGYKRTEVGVIPEDWEVKLIKEIAQITTGDKDTQNRKDDGKYPFYVRSQTIERINSYSFDGEAVLTSGDGVGVGKIFHYVNGKFDYHQRVYNIHSFNNYSGKLFYYFFSNFFFDRVMQMTAKSSVDSVRREMISEMQVPVPSILSEQIAIAQVLTDTDQLIQNLKTLIAKKKAIKLGAMQELLTGKTDWQVVLLGKESELITKGTTPTSIGQSFTRNGVNFVKVESLKSNGKFNENMFAYINLETHSILQRSQLKANDLLISIAGALGRTGIVDEKILPANTNQALAIIRLNSNSRISLKYLYHYLRTEKIKKHIDSQSSQGAQPNLSLKDISELPIVIPISLEEQKAIAQILSDMDSEIDALDVQLQKTQNLKQGMMQELLTGKTRLAKSNNANITYNLPMAAEPLTSYKK